VVGLQVQSHSILGICWRRAVLLPGVALVFQAHGGGGTAYDLLGEAAGGSGAWMPGTDHRRTAPAPVLAGFARASGKYPVYTGYILSI
jgi:hypothetical protein